MQTANGSSVGHDMALRLFRQARRQADRETLVARLTGRSPELLCFGQVRKMLGANGSSRRGIHEIPLDFIVGSVERCSDFTRSYLPLKDSDQERWTGVQQADHATLPPIKTYQIGDVYFVPDGHHRVSVARHRGWTHIQASVTGAETRVPLSPDVQPDEMAIKAAYVDFLDRSHLDRVRPGVDLSVTMAGNVRALEKQIEAQQVPGEQDSGQMLAYREAAVRWYDEAYSPVARVLRARDVLHSFPGRTEADLFLWLSDHRESLQSATGWPVGIERAADDLVARHGETSTGVVARSRDKVLDRLVPEELQAGPQPGQWRREREITNVDECLFGRILVPISESEGDWLAVAQAAEIACRESAQLLGLHVVPLRAVKEGKQILDLRHRFEQRCKAHGVEGRLAIEAGQVSRTVFERSRWADLVVIKPDHAPPLQSLERLGCGFHTLIRRSVTPVLAAPGAPSLLERPLLAFDGTPMAREALFVAAYLALRAQVRLVVVAAQEEGLEAGIALAEARTWLERHGVHADYVQEEGPAAEAILRTADAHERDLIVMGGYGHRPLVEVMLGSTVDQVLHGSRHPVLICR